MAGYITCLQALVFVRGTGIDCMCGHHMQVNSGVDEEPDLCHWQYVELPVYPAVIEPTESLQNTQVDNACGLHNGNGGVDISPQSPQTIVISNDPQAQNLERETVHNTVVRAR
jgi:hypothetical protein